MKKYLWNKFWLWLSKEALYRTTLIDTPYYSDAESGLVDCQDFNEQIMANHSY